MTTLPATTKLTRADAIELGNKIRAAATLWLSAQETADRHALTCGELLAEAFEGQAHIAAGMTKFSEWATAATGLSKSHQHRLRAHQDTLRKVAGAAGVDVDDLGDTPERVTRAARRDLDDITEETKRRTAGKPRAERAASASEVMRERRRQEQADEQNATGRGTIVQMRPAPSTPAYSTGRGEPEPTIGDAAGTIDLDRLEEALDFLATIDPELLVLSVPEGRAGVMRSLPKAALRVAALADAWERREREG